MEVTDVRIRKINHEGKMKAIVSITLNEEFVVHDVRVIEGNNGMFVAMPSKRTPDGEFKDIAHPITSQTREVIQSAVLTAYDSEMDKQEAAADGITQP
ncbi:MAG: septation protein SpoVG [Candidatus Syntrophonatronum acetioxidans]|uniref:Putative septation protein SpoVG n=1 Tax=Candidatus Syntrophonatronum acetioxidans TaxID=1795816 RepID=A0A424YD04_9FIRM|nr:MAG: septation protein SpoVG [Candidatus Syntrophonatronum acetioxidans]